MSTRIRFVAFVLGMAVICANCGDSTAASSTDRSDPDAVAEAFGRSYAAGSGTEWLEFLTEKQADEIRTSAIGAFLEAKQPDGAELRGYEHVVVEEADGSMAVTYKGELCFMEATQVFPSSSTAGNSSSEGSSVSKGKIDDSELVCQPIDEAWAPILPIELKRIDGEWFVDPT